MGLSSTYFFCGVAALTLAAWARGPWLALAWLSISLFSLAYAYARDDASVLGKRPDGRLRTRSALLLLPYLVLLGGFFHLRRLLEPRDPWNEVAPGIYLGRRVVAGELPPEVDMVVDLTAALPEPCGVTAHRRYLALPTLDRRAPAEQGFRDLLRQVVPFTGRVYVHCRAGMGRSAAVAAALLIARGLAESAEQAESLLRRVRPGVRLYSPQRELVARTAGSISRAR